MNKFSTLAVAGAAALAMSAPASAEQLYGFATASVNYLDWTDKAEDRASFGGKKDFMYLEVEGGAGFSWGDVYGFFDIENPQNLGDEDAAAEGKGFRIATKGSVAVNIGQSNWNLYGHVYHFEDTGFFDTNVVLGASYDIFTKSGFWMKPFIGAHIENQTFAGNGFNGYMAGWVLGYDFQVGGQKLSISQWHETEFGRKDQFRNGADGRQLDSYGQNGAVALWWHLPNNFTAGLQYRYFDQKLGDANYGDALIYTLKYNF
ncbi:outer membrane protein OmpK [Ferrimonas balearica]|uniref:outer membrane protein OmpK n=1 Tax=Ferrimonas balearica TaxID=44012 RepID=UPI0021BDCB5F|nr:outer membrane protein OmpK [Ferrimonas balearica]